MASTQAQATVVIVPGLRDDVAEHWQTLLATQLRAAGRPTQLVPPMGRTDLDCAARVAAIERAVHLVQGPVVLVAHSGGCIMVAHWAGKTRRPVMGALLATPADLDIPLPEGYPGLQGLAAGGWLPVPRRKLPFRSIVALSRNDPLGAWDRVNALADDWGSDKVDLGEVGHLNPASGYGPWPMAQDLIQRLLAQPGPKAPG